MKAVPDSRSSNVDRIAGWLYILFAVVVDVMAEVLTVLHCLHDTPAHEEMRRQIDPPLWAGFAGNGFVIAYVLIIGLGVVRVRAWALWLLAITSLHRAFESLVSPLPAAHDAQSNFFSSVHLVVFLYAGLRILGVLGDGPRPLFRRANAVPEP